MQKRPQLFERVLKRRSGDEQPMIGVEFNERLIEKRVLVFEPMSFVHDQYSPRDIVKEGLLIVRISLSSLYLLEI